MTSWNQSVVKDRPAAQLKKAAVLLLLFKDADGDIQVILTLRAKTLRQHGGQISFPGGSADPSDGSLAHTALRETWEEIGLRPEAVRILGRLPMCLTTSNFLVAPYVGWTARIGNLTVNAAEVEEVLYVPLAHLLNPEVQCHYCLDQPGQRRGYYGLEWQTHFIWGATASILRNFYHLLAAAESTP